jgi:hypothetical protein
MSTESIPIRGTDEEDNSQERIKLESQLAGSQFLIEATVCEWHELWAAWYRGSQRRIAPHFNQWVNLDGWGVQVGELFGRPVCISIQMCLLDGFLVAVWYPVSNLVDYSMIWEWLDKHFTTKTEDGRLAACDAMNFHHCVIQFDVWKGKQG